jgi:hypothetical protein
MRIHGKGSKSYGTAEDMIAEIERLNAKVTELTTDRDSKVRLLDLANKALERAGSAARFGGKLSIPEGAIVFTDTAEEIEQRLEDDAQSGIWLIANERERQINQEGWSAEYDRKHVNGELAIAAACYALPQIVRMAWGVIQRLWPWDIQWFKPDPYNRIRELVKAGALIAAEIDRLQHTEEVKSENNISLKDLAYKFLNLPYIIRQGILCRFDFIDTLIDGINHTKALPEIINKAKERGCLEAFYLEIDRLRVEGAKK